MRNELNLFVMSAQEVIRWYKPQTEEESYLVDLLSEILIKGVEELHNEIDNLTVKNEILENDKSNLEEEISNLTQEAYLLKRTNGSLEERVSDLENQIIEALDRY